MSPEVEHVLVVGASPAPGFDAYYAELIGSAFYVIAADAGAELCRAVGRPCDLCVGDMDSISAETLAWLEAHSVPLQRHATDKDQSDLDLAVEAARGAGATRLDLTAAFHGRLDHTIAALGTLLRSSDLRARATEPSFTAYALDASTCWSLSLGVAVGTGISLFAAEDGTVVTTRGLRYALDRAQLPRHSSLGLSNVAMEPTQRVELERGRVLVMVNTAAF